MSEDKKLDQILDESAAQHSRSLGARVRGYFLAGILVTAPITITVYLTYVFLSLIDNTVSNLIPQQWYEDLYGHTTVPGVGLVLAIAFFVVVGWFATNVLGRLLIRIAEYFVDRVPVIRTLYGAVKQIFETVMATQSQAFREVVMLEYPRKNVWSIGFVTGTSKGEVQEKVHENTVNVFVPTTPNPTSGYLLFVPREELHFLDMSVEEGVKLVVSAGIITPPYPPEKKADKKKKSASKKKPSKKA